MKNWLKNILWLLILLVLTTSRNYAQQAISTNEVLAPLLEPSDSLNYNVQLDFLNFENQRIPIIEKLEFRTETDEFDLGRQEYMFRSSFNSLKSRKVQDDLNRNRINYYKNLESEFVEDYLEEQFELLISWYYAKKELSQLDDILSHLLDLKQVNKKIIQSSTTIDLIELIKIDQELLELERDKLKLNSEIDQLKSKIFTNASITGYQEISDDNWVSIGKMKSTLDLLERAPNKSANIALQELRLNEASLNHEFEIAESKKILDFVQIKYAGRKTEFFREEFSIGAGINIPTGSSERLKINDAKLDIYDEQFEYKLLAFEQTKRVAELYGKFETIFNEYQLIIDQEKQQDLPDLFEQYASSGLADPLSLLQINETILDYKRDKLELEKEACGVYYEILREKGKINILEPINYLNESQPTY